VKSTDQDVVILGAGGAGLFCALHTARLGRSVTLVDHSTKLGAKILISGGGRCNFTNLGASPANYVSRNPHFCKSALSRFKPQDFIGLVESHGITYHEKKLGQLFCDETAADLVTMLRKECLDAGVKISLEAKVLSVKTCESSPRFEIQTSQGPMKAKSVVVATGGLSIPKIGATGIGYQIAQSFGLALIDRDPALDGFVLGPAELKRLGDLSGLSADCTMTVNGVSFRENLLITHAGLSGPASLQASLHWNAGDPVLIDFLPQVPFLKSLQEKRRLGQRTFLKSALGEHLAQRLADRLCEIIASPRDLELPLAQLSDQTLTDFCDRLHRFEVRPTATVGYSKAEVTRGGVDTDELSSKTMESKKVPGLYFIGEVVDVTGWLGGYNFQWAWASAWAAAQALGTES
jgi:predicted Rossmann fold flavoprotein